MKFALVLNNEVKEYRQYPEQPVCKIIDGLKTIRPVEEEAQPSIGVNQKLVGPTVSILDDKVIHSWQAVDLTPEEIKARIPDTVSMYQARIALQQAGLLATVQAGISQMSQEAQIKWEFAPTVKRNDALTVALASALSLTEEQLDALFTAAAAII
jgi:hypothetical protein